MPDGGIGGAPAARVATVYDTVRFAVNGAGFGVDRDHGANSGGCVLAWIDP